LFLIYRFSPAFFFLFCSNLFFDCILFNQLHKCQMTCLCSSLFCVFQCFKVLNNNHLNNFPIWNRFCQLSTSISDKSFNYTAITYCVVHQPSTQNVDVEFIAKLGVYATTASGRQPSDCHSLSLSLGNVSLFCTIYKQSVTGYQFALLFYYQHHHHSLIILRWCNVFHFHSKSLLRIFSISFFFI